MKDYKKVYEKQFGSTGSKDKTQLEKNQRTINNSKLKLASAGVNPDEATDTRNSLEKLLNLKQDQNFIFDIMDILDRPKQALFGGIENLQNGEDFLEGAKQGITGNKDTSFKDILMNTGAFEDTTFQDASKESDSKLGALLKSIDLVDVLGYAGDVFLDPMNIPFIPTKVGTTAGKLADTTLDIAKGTGEALDTAADVGKNIYKLKSADDLLGMATKKAIKGTANLANKSIESALEAIDKSKGITYGNAGAKDVADMLRSGSKVGKLENFKQLKNDLTNMFKVSDKSRDVILKGRDADFKAKLSKMQMNIIGNDVRDKITQYAAKNGLDADEVAKYVTLYGESLMDRSISYKDLIKRAQEGGLRANDNIIGALEYIKGTLPKELLDSGDFAIDITKKGSIKLGSGWNKNNLKQNLKDLGVNLGDVSDNGQVIGNILNDKFDYGNWYSDEDKELLDKLAKDNDFQDLYNSVKDSFNKANEVIDKTFEGTSNLSKLYNATNEGYVPQTVANKDLYKMDLGGLLEGKTKANTNILDTRSGLGSMRERNEWYRQSFSDMSSLTDKQKEFFKNNPDVFEENFLKAFENRYFDEMPKLAKQNDIVNNLLLEQTFGDAKEIKQLQSKINKYQLSGDMENLKKVTEQYNKLTQNSNIKFLTKYDNKIPSGYRKLTNEDAKNLIKKMDKLSSQFGNDNLFEPIKKILNKNGKTPIAINEDILRMLEISTNTSELKGISRMYNKWLNAFKKWKVSSPTFLLNSLTGNSSNLYLSGINMTDQARYSKKALDIVTKGEELYNKKLLGQVLSEADDDIAQKWYQFAKSGFGDSSISLSLQDMPDDLKKLFESGDVKGFKKLAPTYINNKLNNIMDNQSRAIIMLKAIDDPSYLKNLGINGKNTTENIYKAISKVMFDPSMMTDFEKSTMKKIIPFYTYTKNNLVYQISNMGDNFGRYKKTYDAIKELQKNATGGNEDNIPDYLKNNLYIPVPALGKDGSYTVIRTQLPFGNLTDTLSDPLGSLANMSNPLIKQIYESASGVNTFTGREIEKFPGEKSKSQPILDDLGNLLGIDITPTKKQENIFSNISGLDVPIKNINRIYEGYSNGREQGDNILSSIGQGLLDTVTMQRNIESDKLSKSYDQINQLQETIKKYKQEGYQFSTIGELRKANKNKTIANIDALFAKYGVGDNKTYNTGNKYYDYYMNNLR